MTDAALRLSQDGQDWAIALGLIGAWLALTIVLLVRHSRSPAAGAEVLVVHASQTGHAGDLALQAQLRVEAGGTGCALVEADDLTAELLAAAEVILFVASTTGEGEAPDNARRFERGLLAANADLSGKQVAVLALGDRRYAQFCAFGHRIARWAAASGAEQLCPVTEIDDLGAADLATWDGRLTAAGYPPAATRLPAAETGWQVVSREQVAGPSRNAAGALTGDGLFRIALRSLDLALPTWEIGDLFELRTPDGHLRDYSIASLPGDDDVVLFVRRVTDGGVPGIGSGHLTHADPGAIVSGRLRSHRSFRPPSGQGPLLAIGAGSGWAGLRPHLLHAITLGQPCRLLFGERASEANGALLAEMREWQGPDRLERLDLALSQPGGSGPYVQHVLAEEGPDIARFLGTQGRIVICGRLTMGEQVLAELARLLGDDWLELARAEGRLLRDLY